MERILFTPRAYRYDSAEPVLSLSAPSPGCGNADDSGFEFLLTMYILNHFRHGTSEAAVTRECPIGAIMLTSSVAGAGQYWTSSTTLHTVQYLK